MSDLLTPPEPRTKPCAGCGDQTPAADDNGRPQCADCLGVQERRNAAIMDFYAALPDDLQAAFDTADAVFDSGIGIAPSLNGYRIILLNGEIHINWSGKSTFNLSEIVQWCDENRGMLQ